LVFEKQVHEGPGIRTEGPLHKEERAYERNSRLLNGERSWYSERRKPIIRIGGLHVHRKGGGEERSNLSFLSSLK